LHGLQIGMGLGVRHCFQRGCRGGGIARGTNPTPQAAIRLEVGYFFRPVFGLVLAGGVSLGGLRPRQDEFPESEGRRTGWYVGPGVELRPVRKRWSLSAELAFVWQGSRSRVEYRGEDGGRRDDIVTLQRVGVRLGLGALYSLGDRVSIGPHLEQLLPLSGVLCRANRPSPGSVLVDYDTCEPVGSVQASERRSLPWPFVVGLRVVERF
jgi:hypothetical protein